MSDALLANRYRTLRTLGEGAMGKVLLVEDQVSGQDVALKIVSTRRGAVGGGSSSSGSLTGSKGGVAVLSRPTGGAEKSLLQFKQEFRLMTQLRHPNCCAVYDYGVMGDAGSTKSDGVSAGQTPYFTMEVVPGLGLDECVPLAPERVREVLAQLLLALGYVHQLGFVHCDIKSANVRLRPEGVVKLMDYGLMDYANRAHVGVRGTLPYVSPEVVRRAPLDRRSDLYAVGALAYEMLTGQVPFIRKTAVELLRAHVSERPEPLSSKVAGIPADLERVVLKLLAKEPLERYQSAYEVLAALGVEVPTGIGGMLLASPMHGREPETRALAERLAQARDGQGGPAMLVQGPAGVGKSRLLEEFRYQVQLEGLPLALGACFELSQLPYQPFVQLLRGLMPSLREHVPALLAEHAPVLVKLLPELNVPAAEEMDTPAKEKLRLHAAVTSLLVALAGRVPFVAILEDWQWADPLSAELLTYMARATREAAWLLLVAARPWAGEAPAWHEQAQRLELAPLDHAGVAKMVASMLGSEAIAPGFIEQLERVSEGNPFFVERLLEHLVEDGTLKHDGRGWSTDVALDLDGLPRNVRALLVRKLESLSADALAIARAAAVLGRDFDLDLLVRVVALPEERFFEAMAELRQAAVLLQDEAGRYAFAQDAVQAHLVEALPEAERKRLHQAAADAWLARVGHLPLPEVSLGPLMAIANHLLGSVRPQAAIAYALEAGQRNMRLFAGAEATRFLQAGLALIRAEADPRWEPQKLQYLYALGDVMRIQGQAAKARETLEEAVPLAEAQGERVLLGRMLTSLAKACQIADDYEAALAHATRSVEVCEAAGDAGGAARALLTVARVRYFRGNVPAAIAAAEEAVRRAEASGERGFIGMAFAFLGYLFVAADPDRIQAGIDNLSASLELLGEVGDRIGLANSYNLLGNAQTMQGEFASARDSFSQNLKLAQETAQLTDEVLARVNLSIVALERGEFGEATAQAGAAIAQGARVTSRMAVGMAMANEGLAWVQQGRAGEGLARVEEALAMAHEIKNKYLEAGVRLGLTEVLVLLGRFGEAQAAADALKALIGETGNTEPALRLDLLQAELQARRGEHAAARSLADAALAAARAAKAAGKEARAQATRAHVALAAQDWAGAEQAAREGLALAERVGARAVVMSLQDALGEWALATGKPEAFERYQAMAETAAAIGSPDGLARALFGQAAARAYDAGSAELVARAQETLRGLLASMPERLRDAFVTAPERARVLAGNHIAFGLPREVRRNTGPLPRLPGFGTGGLA